MTRTYVFKIWMSLSSNAKSGTSVKELDVLLFRLTFDGFVIFRIELLFVCMGNEDFDVRKAQDTYTSPSLCQNEVS